MSTSSYVANIINALHSEAAKIPLTGTPTKAKQKKLSRMIKCLEKATPFSVKSDPVEYSTYKLVSIDAWADEGSWVWNNHFLVEEGIYIAEDSDLLGNSRKLLKWMRDQGWLSEESKGKLAVDWSDLDVIEIVNKNTREPYLALTSIH